ncbi:MAG: hypothetical protein COZ21_03480 [Bacteroidetes bacterium CG_4_10_14_3_um_filter_31_20]|nr:MAG: hypothetical protein COZ21_03480 [Bacteroidetes bacterium CG_4_10_14_3_um_filter_31_20]
MLKKTCTMQRQFINILALTAIIVFLYSCQTNPNEDSGKTNSNIIQVQNTANSNWLDKFDFDGDSLNDHIYFDFSGGAHCCYKINIVLSSDNTERKFPFEMDGGYIGGVDNSQPDQFDIRDIDSDGLPEILMRIQTYNGESGTIPAEWNIDYGIKSNFIVIEYTAGQLKTRDYKP